jgi:hypothetical protein
LVNNFKVHGTKRDFSSCQAINTGFLSSAKRHGTVKWISTGADHNSDFYGNYDGISLAFGRKTGYGSHGPKFST